MQTAKKISVYVPVMLQHARTRLLGDWRKIDLWARINTSYLLVCACHFVCSKARASDKFELMAKRALRRFHEFYLSRLVCRKF